MNKNEVVYVVTIDIFKDWDEFKQVICICSDLKTAYKKIKDDIAVRNRTDNYLKYCSEKNWRRVTGRTLVKSFEWQTEYDDVSDVSYDYIITRWEVM